MRWPVKINRYTKQFLNHTDWFLINDSTPRKAKYLIYFNKREHLRSEVVFICTVETSLNRNADQMVAG